MKAMTLKNTIFAIKTVKEYANETCCSYFNQPPGPVEQ